jgi:hypothetical protein
MTSAAGAEGGLDRTTGDCVLDFHIKWDTTTGRDMRYRLEQQIETLADNAVMKDGRIEAAFVVDQVRYSQQLGIRKRSRRNGFEKLFLAARADAMSQPWVFQRFEHPQVTRLSFFAAPGT